ncbi:MAG: hypothetical protein J3R72DRAFT_506572 [Linnemannia gamsii]|nr:MAG: hypothetical protein J3R72DRAFT_506572 [Linnemannia gamsii]
MPTVLCPHFDRRLCRVPLEDQTEEHNKRYHEKIAVIVQRTGFPDITVERSAEYDNHYPCPSTQCPVTTNVRQNVMKHIAVCRFVRADDTARLRSLHQQLGRNQRARQVPYPAANTSSSTSPGHRAPMNSFLRPDVDMGGSYEEHEQAMVQFQNTVMALLGYSQSGYDRLFEIEGSIDGLKANINGLKADLTTSLKQLMDNNKDLSIKQNKILDNTAKLMNKTEGLLDRMEKFTSERPQRQMDSLALDGFSLPGGPVNGRLGLGTGPRRNIPHLDDHDQAFSESESPEYQNSMERNMAQAQVIARHNEEFSRGMEGGEEYKLKTAKVKKEMTQDMEDEAEEMGEMHKEENVKEEVEERR